MLTDIVSAHQTSTALIRASAEAIKQQVEDIERNQITEIKSMFKDGLSSVQFVMNTVQRSVHNGRVDAEHLHQQSNIQLSRIESQISGLEKLIRNIAKNSSQSFKGGAVIEAIAPFREEPDDSEGLKHRDIYLVRMWVILSANQSSN